jgi:hypothetical protein
MRTPNRRARWTTPGVRVCGNSNFEILPAPTSAPRVHPESQREDETGRHPDGAKQILHRRQRGYQACMRRTERVLRFETTEEVNSRIGPQAGDFTRRVGQLRGIDFKPAEEADGLKAR